jgi:hypothetical protein
MAEASYCKDVTCGYSSDGMFCWRILANDVMKTSIWIGK